MAKILIVDDDSRLRETIQMVLKLRGYDVIEADNGADALKMARAQLPDLILSDINMPQGDGFTALSDLRKDPLTAAIPLILMTGEVAASGMRRGMELGADDFLTKPFAMGALIKAMDARLKKQEVVKQAAEKKLAELRANISLMLPHELNTPLVGILGYGEIIATCADTLQPSELAEMGRNILTSGQRLQRLIQNFLIYAQLEMLRADEQEQAAMRARRTEDIVTPLTLVAKARASESGRAEDLQLDLEPATVAMAEDLMRKVVDELVNNAFKFSTAGTPVHIGARVVGKSLQIQVADRGRGMKTEHMREIAGYVQFDRCMHEQQGTGLGLAIAQRLTEMHGGTLNIQSAEQLGTTITLSLPVAA